MTRVSVTIEDVRLANAKLMAGVRPDFSAYPQSVQAAVREMQSSLPDRLPEAVRQAMQNQRKLATA